MIKAPYPGYSRFAAKIASVSYLCKSHGGAENVPRAPPGASGNRLSRPRCVLHTTVVVLALK